MRSSLSGVATTIVVGLLVVGCTSTTSPAPSTTAATQLPVLTPTPIPTPISSPAADGWPYVTGDASAPAFGPDGTVYLLANDAQGAYQRTVVALDAAGHVKPGWPIEAPPRSSIGSLAVGPDGSVYIGECGGREAGCVLHRLGATGRELPGWPFEVPPDFACEADSDSCYLNLDIGSDGTVYVDAHWRQAGGLDLIAIDPAGEIKPGWPVALDDQAGWWSNQQISPDGTLFILWRPTGSPTIDEFSRIADNAVELWAIAPDGSPRPDWPVSVPAIGGYVLGPQGSVVVWSLIDLVGEICPQPRRTVFTVLGADGRTLPGWPRESDGSASRPVIRADGTVYYVSAGNLYAHDRTGEIKAGWPVAVPGALGDCGAVGPQVARDGTIFALGDEVTARSADGRSRPGWPYRPAGQLTWPCLAADCGPYHVGPALGPDGTFYLVVFQPDPAGARAEVVALDRQGQLKPGWPYLLPFDPNAVEIGPLTVSPDGRLFVRGGDLLLALDPDGRISD